MYNTYTDGTSEDDYDEDNLDGYGDSVVSSDLDMNGNVISSGWQQIYNIKLDGIMDNVLFYDSNYLIIQTEGDIDCYNVGDRYDEVDIKVGEQYSTTINCKPIDFDKLPEYIKNSVLKERI